VIKEQNCKEVASSESINYTHALSAHKSPDDSLDLMAALRKLALKYRQVLALQLEGFNQNEIAQTLGLSEDAVAKRASRARQQLASLME
jgi:RNA polymerase sigma-70 factor (ECF subfamily)